METVGLKIEVKLDGVEAPLYAVTDQRDHAAYEGSAAYEVAAGSGVTRVRHLAYTALKRAGQLNMGWEKFNTEKCIQAMVIDQFGVGETEDEQTEDPSQR
jgi:hypothetical protein